MFRQCLVMIILFFVLSLCAEFSKTLKENASINAKLRELESVKIFFVHFFHDENHIENYFPSNNNTEDKGKMFYCVNLPILTHQPNDTCYP